MRTVFAWRMGMFVVVLLAACTHTPKIDTGETAHVTVLPRAMAQVGTGAESAFVVCKAGACPAPTPKTPAWANPATPIVDGQSTSAPTVPRVWIVAFETGSVRLTPQADETVRQVAAELPASGRVTLVGRADDPAREDRILALMRATAVRDRLLRLRPERKNALHIAAEAECERIAAIGARAPCALNTRVLIVFDPAAPPRSVQPVPPYPHTPAFTRSSTRFHLRNRPVFRRSSRQEIPHEHCYFHLPPE
jgi:hypothetical protein